MKKLILALSTLLITQLPASTFAQSFLELSGLSPYTHYKTFETTHFKFIYQEGYFAFAERAAVHIEHAHTILSPILQWQPRTKTVILVADNSDAANGFTAPPLRVGIVLIATPPDPWFSTSYTDDWIKLLVFHEYTHMLNIDPTTQWMEGLRLVFGDIIRPNSLWPIWMLEGLAVYFETRTSEMGRGRSPYYESILRAYFNEGKLGTSRDFGITLDRVNGDDAFFPGGEIPYLFGYHLWKQFGDEAAMGTYSINSSHRVPFFIEGNLENVKKTHWENYWNDFIKESQTRLSGQIAAVKAKGETPSTPISHAEYSAMGGAISPDGRWLAYTEISQTQPESLVLYDLTHHQSIRIGNKLMGVGMGFTPDSRFLIYSAFHRRETYSLFSELYAYDLIEQKTFLLSEGLRAKDPHVSPDGKTITFTRSIKGTHQLAIANLTINSDGKPSLSEIKSILIPKAFSIIGNPHFLNNTTIVFSKQETGKKQSDLFSIQTNGKELTSLLADGSMNRYPFIDQNANDQNKIYFVSDKTGIENIYSMRISTNGHEKYYYPERVTNVVTGTILPFLSSDHQLYASLMTSKGYEIVHYENATSSKTLSNEIVAVPSAPAPIPSALHSPDLGLSETQTENYSPWSSLAPRQWAPLAYTTYNGNAGLTLGGEVLGFDSTGKHEYLLLGGYNFKPKTIDGLFQYSLYYFRPEITFGGSAQTTDVDINSSGYFKRNTEAYVSLQYPISWTYSSLHPRLYGFMDWNGYYNLYSKQKLATNNYEYSNSSVPGFGASVSYSNTQTSALGFMPEKGFEAVAIGENHYNVNQYSVTQYLASLSQYTGLGNHTVIKPRVTWLGSTHPNGYASTIAFLDGKNSNNLFDQGTTYGLGSFEHRGYSNTSFATRQSGVASADYFFPIDKSFSGYGTDPIFLKQLYGFIFAETAFVPSSRFGNLFLPSIGGGLTLDTTLLIRVPIKANLEVQNGTRKDFGGDLNVFLTLSTGALF